MPHVHATETAGWYWADKILYWLKHANDCLNKTSLGTYSFQMYSSRLGTSTQYIYYCWCRQTHIPKGIVVVIPCKVQVLCVGLVMSQLHCHKVKIRHCSYSFNSVSMQLFTDREFTCKEKVCGWSVGAQPSASHTNQLSPKGSSHW